MDDTEPDRLSATIAGLIMEVFHRTPSTRANFDELAVVVRRRFPHIDERAIHAVLLDLKIRKQLRTDVIKVKSNRPRSYWRLPNRFDEEPVKWDHQ